MKWKMFFMKFHIPAHKNFVSNKTDQFISLLVIGISYESTRFSSWSKFGSMNLNCCSKAQTAINSKVIQIGFVFKKKFKRTQVIVARQRHYVNDMDCSFNTFSPKF